MKCKIIGTLAIVLVVVLFDLPYELWGEESPLPSTHQIASESSSLTNSKHDPLFESQAYLVYRPYSGLTQTFISLGKAIYIASQTNRTLVVAPLISAQSNPQTDECIHKQLGNITFFKKCVLPEYDFLKYFYVNQTRLNFTLPRLVPLHEVYDQLGLPSIPCFEEWSGHTCSDLVTLVRQSTVHILCVGNLHYVEHCPPVRQSFQFSQQASEGFDKKMEQYGMVGDFLGIHVRKGDFGKYCRQNFPNEISRCDPSYRHIMRFAHFMKIQYGFAVVSIATNEKDPKELERFPKTWKRSNVTDFDCEVFQDLFDMYMLSKSKIFVGNMYSAFSTFIKGMEPSLEAFVWNELNWDEHYERPKHPLERLLAEN